MPVLDAVFVGKIYLPEIGGGPIIPPGQPQPPEKPPGIWGGAPIPWPTPPIYFPPEEGGGTPEEPPGIWGGAPIPWPTPPIYYPPQIPEKPEEPPSGGDGRWGYVPRFGWVWVPASSGGKPKPPGGGEPVVTPH